MGIVTVTLLTLVFLNEKDMMKKHSITLHYKVTWNIDEPGRV